MRQVVPLVLAACVIGASAAATEAQMPSPAPIEGTRVELPEFGFAMTPPEGWLVICPWSEEALRRLGASQDVSKPRDEEERAIVESLAALFTECQLIVVRLADQGREVADVCKADAGPLIPGTFDFNVTYLFEALSDSDDTVAIATLPVDLPGGQAAVIDVEYRTRNPRHWANYLVEGDRVVLGLACTGPERPEDDWLSVAAAFEFLPEE